MHLIHRGELFSSPRVFCLTYDQPVPVTQGEEGAQGGQGHLDCLHPVTRTLWAKQILPDVSNTRHTHYYVTSLLFDSSPRPCFTLVSLNFYDDAASYYVSLFLYLQPLTQCAQCR